MREFPQLFITGATSKTGNAVVERLAARLGADNLTCLVRQNSDTTALRALGVPLHIGDVTEPHSYLSLLGPQVAVLDMSRIRYTHHLLEALETAGVQRGYFVSTTAIYSRFQSMNALYLENETKIKNSGVTWTILRPSMIYGSPRDKNMHRLIGFLARAPFFPLFGDGKNLMQPVFVDDLAEAIALAVDPQNSERTAGSSFDLAGPQAISYREIIDTIIAQLGRRVPVVPLPAAAAARVAKIGQKLPGFPIKEEQILRLSEDKAFDIAAAAATLNFAPRSFETGIAAEIAAMREAGLIP